MNDFAAVDYTKRGGSSDERPQMEGAPHGPEPLTEPKIAQAHSLLELWWMGRRYTVRREG